MIFAFPTTPERGRPAASDLDTDEIGGDPEVFVGEELAGSSDPRLNLIHGEDKTVTIGQFAHRRQEPVWWDEEPTFTDHRLDDHHRDLGRVDE